MVEYERRAHWHEFKDDRPWPTDHVAGRYEDGELVEPGTFEDRSPDWFEANVLSAWHLGHSVEESVKAWFNDPRKEDMEDFTRIRLYAEYQYNENGETTDSHGMILLATETNIITAITVGMIGDGPKRAYLFARADGIFQDNDA